jgi:hypothetical protein
VTLQSGTACLDGIVEQAGATILIGQRGEGDRRRVLLDPALQLVDAGVVGHVCFSFQIRYGAIVTVVLIEPVLPESSVTVSVTV